MISYNSRYLSQEKEVKTVSGMADVPPLLPQRRASTSVYFRGEQNDYNMMLQLRIKNVFEIFEEGDCSLVPTPLADLHQRHNAAVWLLYMSSFGPRSN